MYSHFTMFQMKNSTVVLVWIAELKNTHSCLHAYAYSCTYEGKCTAVAPLSSEHFVFQTSEHHSCHNVKKYDQICSYNPKYLKKIKNLLKMTKKTFLYYRRMFSETTWIARGKCKWFEKIAIREVLIKLNNIFIFF